MPRGQSDRQADSLVAAVGADMLVMVDLRL